MRLVCLWGRGGLGDRWNMVGEAGRDRCEARRRDRLERSLASDDRRRHGRTVWVALVNVTLNGWLWLMCPFL